MRRVISWVGQPQQHWKEEQSIKHSNIPTLSWFLQSIEESKWLHNPASLGIQSTVVGMHIKKRSLWLPMVIPVCLFVHSTFTNV